MGKLKADEVAYKLRTFQFLEALIQLGHFYLGYSIIVRRALGLSTEPGT